MKTYSAERTIANFDNDRTSVVVKANLTEDKSDLLIDSLNRIAKATPEVQKAVAKLADKHPDLMYGSAILVSTVINKNDDVFLPEETWKARSTPVNTPYNDQHVEQDIIGHIIASRVLAKDKTVVADDSNIPDYFDIEVDWVIYKSIFPAIAQEIFEKAPKGEKFVSMEARFTDFDYAFVNMDTKAFSVVARNEETAFLTKYLRVYGGEGIYKNNRIARVLRNITFCGMGNVDTPANPSSEYTNIEGFELVNSSLQESKSILLVTKGKIMKIDTLEQATAEIERLTKELSDLQGEKAQSELQKKVDTAEAEKASLTDQLNAEVTKRELAETKLSEAETKVNELTASLETAKNDLKAKSDELDAIHKTAKSAERLTKLKELGYEVPDEKKDKIASLSDESFANLVEFAELHKPAPKKEEGEGETQAAQALEGAEAEGADITNTGGEQPDSQAEEMLKTAAKFIEHVRGSRKNVAKSKNS